MVDTDMNLGIDIGIFTVLMVDTDTNLGIDIGIFTVLMVDMDTDTNLGIDIGMFTVFMVDMDTDTKHQDPSIRNSYGFWLEIATDQSGYQFGN